MEAHDILKILDDLGKRSADAGLMAEVYDKLASGVTDLPADIQKKALEIIAGRKVLEHEVFDKDVKSFVLSITGTIGVKDVISFFDARGEQKGKIYAILRKMETDGIIVRTGSRHGVYRIVDRDVHVMNLDDTDDEVSSLYLPMLLHTMVELFPRNVILVSGEKDSGKTCFALNTAYENRDRFHVTYFNSEMGTHELRRRLEKFPPSFNLAEWKKIEWMEQAKRFEDHIDPDGLNIIDFLEVGSEAYTVTDDIRRVFDKLNRGLLLIVMQKRSYKDFAVGGEGTLEKARLAVNLEHSNGENLARITVAKNWKGDKKPRGQCCRYKIIQGGQIQMDGQWYDPEKVEANQGKTQKGFTKKTAKGYTLGMADPDFPHEE